MSKMYDVYAKQNGSWKRKGGMNGGASGMPIEVSTEAQMNELLEGAEVGTIYKYTGESGAYENGAMYLVEEGE